MNKRLTKALKGKQTAIDAMDVLLTTAGDADRVFTAEEQSEFDQLKENVEV